MQCVFYKLDRYISGEFPPQIEFTKQPVWEQNTFYAAMNVIQKLLKSRWKSSQSSFTKCCLFRKYYGLLKIIHHKDFFSSVEILIFFFFNLRDVQNWCLLVLFTNVFQLLELGETEAQSQKLNSGLARGWKELHYFSCSPGAFQGLRQEIGVWSQS